jgi:hypothetical protein
MCGKNSVIRTLARIYKICKAFKTWREKTDPDTQPTKNFKIKAKYFDDNATISLVVWACVGFDVAQRG